MIDALIAGRIHGHALDLNPSHDTKMDPQAALRKRWRVFYREWWTDIQRQLKEGIKPSDVIELPTPSDFKELRCGATKSNGEPCKNTAAVLYESGRCGFHGGCSTGPKTEVGRQVSRENGAKGGRPRKT